MEFGERSTEGKIYWVPYKEQMKLKRARELSETVEE
jgi:hypothetical protein